MRLPFGRVYRNRMIGLLILGIAHGCLFFPGDILAIYAVTGSILYRFRGWPTHRLVRVGVLLLAFQMTPRHLSSRLVLPWPGGGEIGDDRCCATAGGTTRSSLARPWTLF